MGFLSNIRGYLSGPIQYDESGLNWRVEPKKVLIGEFGINLFDPFSDPKQQWVSKINEAQAVKDYETIATIAKSFVRKDMSLVDRSDLLIAYLPHKVPTTGSCHEIIQSHNCKKPTLIICPEGKEKIPVWYFGFIPHQYMFGSWDELYEYLRGVDSGQCKDDFRWAFVYGLV